MIFPFGGVAACLRLRSSTKEYTPIAENRPRLAKRKTYRASESRVAGEKNEKAQENTMGGVVKAVSSMFGGGDKPKAAPVMPDYEAERKKAEEVAQNKRAALASKGMSGTILGGSTDDENVKKKKLLGQ